jgi:hypothetical protein
MVKFTRIKIIEVPSATLSITQNHTIKLACTACKRDVPFLVLIVDGARGTGSKIQINFLIFLVCFNRLMLKINF